MKVNIKILSITNDDLFKKNIVSIFNLYDFSIIKEGYVLSFNSAIDFRPLSGFCDSLYEFEERIACLKDRSVFLRRCKDMGCRVDVLTYNGRLGFTYSVDFVLMKKEQKQLDETIKHYQEKIDAIKWFEAQSPEVKNHIANLEFMPHLLFMNKVRLQERMKNESQENLASA